MMDFVYLIIGLNVMVIFMFKIEWLFDVKSFIRIAILSLLLFFLADFLMKSGIDKSKTIASLKMPIISVIIFFILYQVFKYKYKRNPENTFWSHSKRPLEDVIFSILFWLFGVGLPFFLIR